MGLALALAVALELKPGSADTVYLKSGYTIDGKVTDNREQKGEVRIDFDDFGSAVLRGADVERIVLGEPEQGASEKYVTVKVKKGADYYGNNSYTGVLSPQSDEETVALKIPGAGKVFIPRVGAEISEHNPGVPTESAEPSPAEGVIKTTHQVLLKNGNMLQGDVLPTAEQDPVKLVVKGLGVITVARDTILPDGIKSLAGTITLPPKPKKPPEVQAPQDVPVPEDLKKELLEQMRTELLDELIDQIIGEKLDHAIESGVSQEIRPGDPADLPLAASQEIQLYVSNLSRQRPRERVWGERQLKRVGSIALPFLEPVVHHPLPLVRRGVQRIIAHYGDRRGAPMAISALIDPDHFVREIAGKTLRDLLPEAGVKYNPQARKSARVKAQKQYRGYWAKLAVDLGREAVYEELTRRLPGPNRQGTP